MNTRMLAHKIHRSERQLLRSNSSYCYTRYSLKQLYVGRGAIKIFPSSLLISISLFHKIPFKK